MNPNRNPEFNYNMNMNVPNPNQSQGFAHFPNSMPQNLNFPKGGTNFYGNDTFNQNPSTKIFSSFFLCFLVNKLSANSLRPGIYLI